MGSTPDTVQNFTSQEIAEVKGGYMASLPFGCIERFAPHLAASVDSWFIAHFVGEGALLACQDHGVKVLILRDPPS